jgi:sodium-dependent dicarboxylate transporter 2/3/5
MALFVLLYAVIRLLFARRHAPIEGAAESILRARRALGPWSAGEKAALAAFLLAVVLWTLPGLAGIVAGADAPIAQALGRALPEGAAAILAASLLFLVPVDWRERRFALDWSEAAHVDWGTILLFGGGLSLGTLAFDTGLADSFGRAVETVAGGMPLALIVLFAVLVADGVTELMSNTATANLLVPVFLALAARGDGSVLPALGATLGCSLALCLPVATPPNALVYGTGRVRLTAMIRAGILLDLGCGAVAWLGLLALAG